MKNIVKNKTLSPEIFQGRRKRKDYFEGWYFKHTNKDENVNFSIIPGVKIIYESASENAAIEVVGF